ncbi:anhydro-N-acetylmuramic acid kinase [Rhodococcus marinonascens]|uniref:anhydro-N-acetylmuramic acid kinase n=1 Tax=Rhodococcus marinonascens TaxID=38311 RepID=UPI0009322C6D|nr:anhydro-N-acetylmuramic acid kinase [Rhodococcus marinonascens]
MIVLSVSSGTSVDAIDVAAADLSMNGGEIRMIPLGHQEVPYSAELRGLILGALPPAAATLETVCRIDTGVGQEFAAAASAAAHDLVRGRAELVVSHGQTLFHWITDGTVCGTLQLGQPAWIAEATGLPVISDLRVNDVAAGGHGAPLASLLDTLLLGGGGGQRSAALNLGGIANVTVVGADRDPVAFDTGPANALLDAAVRSLTGGHDHVDHDGAIAARGQVHPHLLRALLDHPHYRRLPPKSTGKEDFHAGYLAEVIDRTGSHNLAPEDLLATLVEATARTVAVALAPYAVRDVFASGGGTRNPTLMRRLGDNLAPTRLTTIAELGLDPDAKEAYLFALVGFLSWHGLPGSIPACTGAGRSTVAGRITPGAARLRLPTPIADPPHTLRIVHPPA